MEKKMALQHKILLGYIVLMAVIASMVAILLHERHRIKEIEAETVKIRSVRLDINKAHRRITGLAIRGESVVAWEEADYRNYRRHRLLTDSLLQTLKPHCREYVRPGQIDTLRHLLAEKETHLRHIMQNLDRRDERDSLLATQLPEVARRATRVRTVRQKRKGIAGLFGKKEDIRVMPSAGELHALSDSLTAMQRKQEKEMDAYADSLRTRNRTLNIQLNRLINDLDGQAQTAFASRERKMTEAQDNSIRLFTAAISLSIILLFLSYLTIHRELQRNAMEKRKREETIGKLEASNARNEELIRFRRNLIQSVTHDLRSPLTAIRGNAELILEDNNPDDRIRHAGTLLASAGRMTSMINSLLEYFRLDSGKDTPDVRPFRMSSITSALEAEFAQPARKKGLTFTATCHTDKVVSGDRDRILSIGSNLLSNALKFTRSGSVSLTVAYTEGKLVMEVEDTGTGISEEKQGQIFKPFERLGNAATKDGFGLGLAIVQGLADLMGSNVSVKSEPSKGSRFTVTLPLPEAKEDMTDETSGTDIPTIAGRTVLAIDNDTVTLGMMRDMLVRSGAECGTCTNAGELTDRLRKRDYDLLITDLKMPEMNGYEILELLRTSDIGNSRTIPIVAATGAGNLTEEEMKSAGFAALLRKPFSIGELCSAVEACTGAKRKTLPDLSALLTFGDRRRTLEGLAEATEREMEEIRAAVGRKDLKALDGWIHHLRSSWMLMKAEEPLQRLYGLIHGNGYTEGEFDEAVGEVLAQGKAIVRLAKKEMEGLWER